MANSKTTMPCPVPASSLKIEIFSELTCAVCCLAVLRFEKAMELFGHREHLEIAWHAFPPQKNVVHQPGKAGTVSEERSAPRRQHFSGSRKNAFLERECGKLGLEIDLESLRAADSFDAARFLHMAASENLQDKAAAHLREAIFSHGQLASEHSLLLGISEKIGLSRSETAEMLAEDFFSSEVYDGMDRAIEAGIERCPSILIGSKITVSGLATVQKYGDSIAKAYYEFSLLGAQ